MICKPSDSRCVARLLGIGIALLIFSDAALAEIPEAGMSAPAGRCTVAAIQAMSASGTTITAAETTANPVPHCKVEGYVTTNDPAPNKNLFRLQLPNSGWTGRYYFIGLGAAAGYVPTDSQIPAGNPLYKGFAVAGTDTGHEGPMADWSFMGQNKAQAIDHVHRGAHVVALATQKITKTYYDSATLYRYHSGCSGGGRMGMQSIERHPEDYDGVLIGAAAGTSASMIKFIDAAQEMTREPGAWVSPAKLAMAEKHVTAACDATDGAIDGIVNDHRLCKFDVATLQCKSGDAADCLTAPEIKSIKAIVAGPIGPDGKPLTEGMPITNMSTWASFTGSTAPPWSTDAATMVFGKGNAGLVIAQTYSQALFGHDYDAMKFNSRNQADVDAWWKQSAAIDYGMPLTADLAAFHKAGGKVIFWNGVSDPCCSDLDMEKHYLKIGTKVQGGMPEVQTFARFYRVPGMGHCGGGTGPGDAPDELLTALIDFVEHNKPPEAVVTHRGAERVQLQFANPQTKVVSGVVVPNPTGPARDFLLCPYPKTAVFNGSKSPGAVYEAANWSCKLAAAKVAAGQHPHGSSKT
jgi:hypothetical protein